MRAGHRVMLLAGPGALAAAGLQSWPRSGRRWSGRRSWSQGNAHAGADGLQSMRRRLQREGNWSASRATREGGRPAGGGSHSFRRMYRWRSPCAPWRAPVPWPLPWRFISSRVLSQHLHCRSEPATVMSRVPGGTFGGGAIGDAYVTRGSTSCPGGAPRCPCGSSCQWWCLSPGHEEGEVA